MTTHPTEATSTLRYGNAVTVFFASCDWSTRRRPSAKTRWRLLRRRPATTFNWTVAALVRLLTRSPYSHVAVRIDDAVLDPAIGGNRFWPTLVFAWYYPTLLCAMDIDLPRWVDLDLFPPGRRKSIRGALLRWITIGLTESDDCVSTVREVLILGGLPVPRWVVSPRQLHDWMLAHAARSHISFARESSRTVCGLDPDAGQCCAACGHP